MALHKKICIIDDDEIFLLVAKAVIKREGFSEEVLEFKDGKYALDYFKENGDSGNLPDLIILDINMPLMDGWEFLEAMEKIGMASKFKIFISSSSIDPSDLKRAEQNPYVKSFITKPVSPENLKMMEVD